MGLDAEMGKSRSDKQKVALLKRRNQGLKNTVSNDPGFSCQGVVGEFVGYYLRCEVFAQKLQDYYLNDISCEKEDKIYTNTLKKSLEHFSMHFSDSHLKAIFKGGKGKRGEKSARQLRNGYLHQLSSADRTEICDKATDYNTYMEKFLELRIK